VTADKNLNDHPYCHHAFSWLHQLTALLSMLLRKMSSDKKRWAAYAYHEHFFRGFVVGLARVSVRYFEEEGVFGECRVVFRL
jgi:hypothetical protein